jgi:hypothetical protein
MLDDNKDVKPSDESTSDASESTEDPQEETTEGIDSQEESDEKEVVIDYEAELAKEKESRIRAQEIAKFERQRRKDSEKNGKTDETEEGDEKEDVTKAVDERVQELLRAERQDIVDEELEGLTEDKSERKLIEHIYDNKLNAKAFGYTRKGIALALKVSKMIANLPRFEAQLIKKAKVEAKKEIQQEAGMTGASGGASTRRAPKDTGKNLNSSERQLLDFSKKQADQIRRRH